MDQQWHWGKYVVSTDRQRLDITSIHRFLTQESYWAQGRTLEATHKALEHSLCFGLYYQDQQIGFGRALTDYATFAYLLDVFVIKPHRRRGLGKWLVQCILAHPELRGVQRWVLRTRDAHGLYARFGFAPLTHPENTLELNRDPVAERWVVAEQAGSSKPLAERQG